MREFVFSSVIIYIPVLFGIAAIISSVEKTVDPAAHLQEENQRLRKAVEELSILNDLARVISSTMNLDAVIENVIKRSVKAVSGQQGMITLVDDTAPSAAMKTLVRTLDSASDYQEFHLNQNILGWMMMNKKPLVSNDFAHDTRFAGVKTEEELRSLLCVPLLVKNRLIGILAIVNKRDSGIFSDDDTRLLSIIGTQSAQVLENARLYEQERTLATMQEQLRLAARIQMDLLPKAPPSIPGYDIAGRTIPAQLVGGDYYDFISVGAGRWAFCLGDVSGKGLPAAMLMANLQATLRGQALINPSPRECVSRANTLLFQSTSDDKFVTLFYCTLDPVSHVLSYTNAGHEHPFYFGAADLPARLSSGGIVVGMMETFPFEEGIIILQPGDLFVVYSDGVTEARNPEGEFFGEERLCKVLSCRKALRAQDLVQRVVTAVTEFVRGTPQFDDLTILVVRRIE